MVKDKFKQTGVECKLFDRNFSSVFSFNLFVFHKIGNWNEVFPFIDFYEDRFQ